MIGTKESERAVAAVKAFKAMLPGLNAYVRALTGRPSVRVQLGERSAAMSETDGKTITMRPPIALGDKTPHRKSLCDRRDENLQQMCPACRIREAVLTMVYHEVAHIAFDTFAPVSAEDAAELTRRATVELGTNYAKAIEGRLKGLPERIKRTYPMMAGMLNEFLPLIMNALEDARVNRRMADARPGTKRMFEASAIHIFTTGVEQGDSTVILWKDYPLNMQAIIGLYCLASGYDYESWFADEIVEALGDEKLREIASRVATAPGPGPVYNQAFKALARLRELGYCKSERDPEMEDEEDGEEQEQAQPGPGGGNKGENGPPEQDAGSSGEPSSGDDEGGGEPAEGGGDAGDAAGGDVPESPAPDDAGEPDADGDGSDAAADAEGEGPDAEGADGAPSSSGTEDDDAGDGEGEPEGDGGPSSDAEDGEPDSGSDGELSDDDDAQGSGGGEADPDESDGADPEPSDAGGGEGDLESGDGSRVPGGEGDAGTGDNEGGGADDAGNMAPGGLGDTSSTEEDSDSSDVAESGSGDPVGADESSTDDDGDLSDGPASPEHGDAPGDSGSEQAHTDDGLSDEGGGPVGDDSPQQEAEPTSDGGADGADQEHDDRPEPDDSGSEDDGSVIETPDREGVKVDRELGSAAEIEALIKQVLGHSSDGDVDHGDESQAESEAVAVAVIQGEYFETPSSIIRGVREHRNGDTSTKPAKNVANGWTPEFWVGRDSLDAYTRRSLGLDENIDPSESILGPALLHMRVAFSDNKRAKPVRNLKAGKVNARALGKRAWGEDERLFRRTARPGKRSYFVMIGVDISASTIGTNLVLAKSAAMAQAELLNRMGIDFAMACHSGNYAPNEGVSMDVYWIKEPKDPWANRQRELLRSIGPDAANLDGHTIEFYRKVLDRQQATDKIIMYYTDGKMPAENHDEELEILQREIRVCRQKGYTLMGVGIRTDSPVEHGLDTVQVDEHADIVRVVRHLERRLERGVR